MQSLQCKLCTVWARLEPSMRSTVCPSHRCYRKEDLESAITMIDRYPICRLCWAPCSAFGVGPPHAADDRTSLSVPNRHNPTERSESTNVAIVEQLKNYQNNSEIRLFVRFGPFFPFLKECLDFEHTWNQVDIHLPPLTQHLCHYLSFLCANESRQHSLIYLVISVKNLS